MKILQKNSFFPSQRYAIFRGTSLPPLDEGCYLWYHGRDGAVSPVHFRLTKRKVVCNMKDCNCGYCMGGDILAGFGIKICDLDVSQLILFKEQSHPGRVIVAYKDHVSELVDISDEERSAFMADVARASRAVHRAFQPDKVNYGAYGDGGCHLHFHLVPKYRDEFEWGSTFAMNPGKVKLTDGQYAEMIEKIKENL